MSGPMEGGGSLGLRSVNNDDSRNCSRGTARIDPNKESRPGPILEAFTQSRKMVTRAVQTLSAVAQDSASVTQGTNRDSIHWRINGSYFEHLIGLGVGNWGLFIIISNNV